MGLTGAVVCGFLLDLLLADPPWIPHPVVAMGRVITALEGWLRGHFPKTPEGELRGGLVLAAALPIGTFLISAALCGLVARLHPAAGFLLQSVWCWQVLALKGLAVESGRVFAALNRGELSAGRQAVSRIVGRDTQGLTTEGVIKAAVETVAENFSDGVAAPLFYLLIGGAPLALAYKAVNTMDSMVGYRTGRYLYFGRAAARLDDGVNYIPARLAALLWIAAAFLTGHSGKNAWRIWRRDRRNHPSPNSAQTESACAGALGVQLAGPVSYFGQVCQKPTIGDPLRPVEPEDILRANQMLYGAGVLALMLGIALRTAILILLRGYQICG
ncbi:MAG: cobalamin biosynthesis protein CobD [Oscillospiraceae bacterium]|nr:cobalamin biosynthesis protein CobD [Oscillospiraceae bacterium]